MKRKEPAKKKFNIEIGCIEAKTDWRDPRLVVTAWDKDVCKEVTLKFSGPWKIEYMREELKKIVDYWKKTLEGM